MKRALFFASCIVAACASIASAQVTIVKTFPGHNGPNTGGNLHLSADLTVAVSPKFLASFRNGGFTVYSKDDGKVIQPTKSLVEFWTAALKNSALDPKPGEGDPYDPRMFFDPLSSRWFAMSNTHPDREKRGSPMTRDVLIAVSKDDDPTHTWKGVLYQVPKDSVPAIDNNKLGLDKNGLYMSCIVGVKAKVVPMVAIPKADLLWTGDKAPSLEHLNYLETPKAPADPARASHGSRGEEGMIPAYDLNPAKKLDEPMIFINRFQADWNGETVMQIRKVTWSSPTKAEMTGPFTVGLGKTYTEPKDQAAQPPLTVPGQVSPPIRPGGGRVVNAVVKHGSVWAIAATQVGEQPGAFWVEIDLKTLKLVQQGTVGDPKAAIVFASINVDANGNVGIGMNRMSTTEYPSAYVTGRLKSDPPGTLRPMVNAAAGKYAYVPVDWDTSAARAGVGYMDHSTVVVDPSDPTLFWTYQVVTTNDCGPVDKDGKKVGTGAYGTVFVAWRLGPAAKRPTE